MITIAVTGRLTKDPELRRVVPSSGGEPADVCEVRLAARDSRGRVVYLDCAQWGPGGRAAATLLSKGSVVAFVGELRLHESHTTAEPRHFYSAVGRIEFLGRLHRSSRGGDGTVVPESAAAPS